MSRGGAVRRRSPPAGRWGRFPLSELTILAAFTLAAAAVASWGTHRGTWLLAGAVALSCLAGLELALREHFAGYRSHSCVLAGSLAVGYSVPASLLVPLPPVGVFATSVAVFGGAAVCCRRTFARRSRGGGGSAPGRQRRDTQSGDSPSKADPAHPPGDEGGDS